MRRRPLVVVCLLLILGILIGRYIGGGLPSYILLIFTGTLFIGAVGFLIAYEHSRPGKILIFLALALLGAYLYSNTRLPHRRLYAQIEDIKSLKGRVVNYPTHKQDRSTFVIKPKGEVGRLKVFYYHRGHPPRIKVNYGDRLWLGGDFDIPWEFADFNYRRYLLRRHIWGVVSIWGSSQIRKIDQNKGNPILQFGYQAREHLFETMDRYISVPESHLLKALVFGERAYLGENIESTFKNAGIMHVLAVSGLHLGILIGILWWTLWKIEASITWFINKDIPVFRHPYLVRNLRLSATRTYLIILPLVVFYLIMVGFRISLLRASLLFAFLALGVLSADRRWIVKKWTDPINGLAAACLVILLIEPQSLFDIGFQLSFSATALILVSLPLIGRLMRHLPDLTNNQANGIMGMILKSIEWTRNFGLTLLIVSLAAQIGVIPFIAFHFHRIYLLAILANLLIIPLVIMNLWLGVGFLIMAVLPITEAAGVVAALQESLLRFLTQVAGFFGNSPLSYLEVEFGPFFYLLYTVAVVSGIYLLYQSISNQQETKVKA